jgi:hypothetical protein
MQLSMVSPELPELPGVPRITKMCSCTAPTPVTGVLHKLRPDWIQLYIADSAQKVSLIHGKRCEAALPKMPTPTLPGIYHSGVPTVGFTNGAPQTVLSLWNCNHVDVVRHKTIRPDLDFESSAPFSHKINVELIVILAEEGLHSAIASLGELMGGPGNHDASDSSHACKILIYRTHVKQLSMVSPELLPSVAQYSIFDTVGK